ncbi:MAG TPA: precorrin-6y C5,15-methyltransferase (decarboxylating) subunit CbiE [Streptosporangiaceae bacterium]|nr:precorrin-6y C5,15-methyltransferase (decarboxylating) subunit CbiE [Streptosporangiaceae bacterium]
MTISIIGYDGSPLPPAAAGRLAAASLVVGGARQLRAVAVPEGVRQVVMGDVAAALDEIDAMEAATSASASGIVVVAGGDPGFFGIVRAVRARGHAVEVFPALSSVSRAFARAGLSWDDAVVVSAHGRELRRAVNACRAHGKVAVLTGPGAGPAELGRALAPHTPRTFVVCENLGEPAERVERCRPAEATTRTWRDPNVVLVVDENTGAHGTGAHGTAPGWVAGPGPGPAAWALPEAAFDHRDSMVTKAEIRALALARLGPRLGDLIWDIGAGSGAVAIECARFGAAVIAVDRDEAACERVRRNVRAHHVRVAVSRGTAPAVLDHLPDPDAVFVGGGGPEVTLACAERALRRVVVALAAVERVGPTCEALAAAGLSAEAVQLQANRLVALPGDAHRLAAANPVFVVWGTR